MPGAGAGRGFDVSLSRAEISALAKDLGTVDVVMRRQLPKRLREAAKPVVDQARTNAAAVSKQIRIGTRVKLASRRGASVKIIGYSPGNIPLAGLLERGNKGNAYARATFRHPVYGHTDRWVDQPTQPYLQPAVDAKRKEAVDLASKVLDDVIVALKFKH
jgi:hypothetical protein